MNDIDRNYDKHDFLLERDKNKKLQEKVVQLKQELEERDHKFAVERSNLFDAISYLQHNADFAQKLLSDHGGKANLLCVIEHGKWAMHYGTFALKEAAGIFHSDYCADEHHIFCDNAHAALKKLPKGFGEK